MWKAALAGDEDELTGGRIAQDDRMEEAALFYPGGELSHLHLVEGLPLAARGDTYTVDSLDFHYALVKEKGAEAPKVTALLRYDLR